ncbi:MAG: archaeosortase/exosortase family protein [Verrucomicrobiota bacterium JB023]|nr:archaeosortase/exosortase family protein [Verrucomicrobiota bacterium JB023]
MNPAIPVIAYLIALWPQAIWYVRRCGDGSDEPLGLLALLTTLLLIPSTRSHVLASPSLKRIALALLLLTGLVSFFLPPLITSAVALLSISFYSGIIRSAGYASLLLLSLPLLASLDFYLAFPLRLGVAMASHTLLSVLGFEVSRHGTSLLSGGHEVSVDPPCAGLQMMWFTCYLFFTLAALHRLSWVQFLCRLPQVMALTMGANVVRATLLFFPEAQLIMLPSWTHEGLGLLLHALVIFTLYRITSVNQRLIKCSNTPPSSLSVPASA